MNNVENLIKSFIKALDARDKKGTEPYDTTAQVVRVEKDTAWVKIPGGVTETPVQLTINANKGDWVRVRVSGGTAWITGNGTAPPTDDRQAIFASRKAEEADDKAETANTAALSAIDAAEVAQGAAATAQRAADSAQTSAYNAAEYAARALGNLATVQSVAETLAWITQHGTMTLTSDTEPVPSHVYFVQDANGDYTVNSVKYSIVAEPDPDRMASYYELSIDESLNNYVGTHLALTGEGLWLLPAASGGYKILIATGAGSTYTEAGTYIIDAIGETVAKFGEVSVIGVEDAYHAYMRFNYRSMKLIDSEGHDFFHVSDLRGEDGTATLTEIFDGDGSNKVFTPHMIVSDTVSVKVTYNDTTTDYDYDYFFGTYIVENPLDESAPPDGSKVEIIYKTESSDAKAYTFGYRYDPENNLGPLSVVEGRNNQAMGSYSHAEGVGTEAAGYASHTEGNSTEATQEGAHAEGRDTHATRFCSHAEGYHSKANGHSSHAEGYETETKGYASHAQNLNTIAAPDYSTALGQYNKEDSKIDSFTGDGTTKNFTLSLKPEKVEYVTINGDKVNDYNFIKYVETNSLRFTTAPANGDSIKIKYVVYGNAVVVGNGSGENTRSNALELKWNGNMSIAGTLAQSSDRRLKKHIAYLGEEADEFIQKLIPVFYEKDDNRHVGFYAQDVEEVDPWDCMVTEELNGYKTLGYTEIIAPLVAYCQSLEERIKRLEKGE